MILNNTKKMKLLVFLLFVLFGVIKTTYVHEWNKFKITYNKTYRNETEENHRKTIFFTNLQTIQEHNLQYDRGLSSYRVEINTFADYAFEELFPSSKVASKHNRNKIPRKILKTDVPESIDWRDYGVITPIMDQGFCFTCWAFAVVAALEAHVGIHLGRKNQTLSEQNLADCVYESYDCKDEMERTALDDCYEYILENGINTGISYPYEDTTGNSCRYDPNNVGARIKDYVTIPEGDEDEMKTVVGTLGPVSVLITADHSFIFYRSGVYHNENWKNATDQYNHAVTVIGYGNEDGQDYWLVKNEWSQIFGEHGYIKMARNMDNNCGIASYATYPIV